MSAGELAIDAKQLTNPAEVAYGRLAGRLQRQASVAFLSDRPGGCGPVRWLVMNENAGIVRLTSGSGIINQGGGPAPVRRDVEPVPCDVSSRVSSFKVIRVADLEGRATATGGHAGRGCCDLVA